MHTYGRWAGIAVCAFGLIFTVLAQNGTASSAASSATGSKSAAPAVTPDEEAQLYRHGVLGFRYQIPYGWVNRTKEMRAGNDGGKGDVLLAVFEHPPEVTGDGINSAVVIAVESAAAYPRLKTVEDYFGPLTELVTAKGFKPDGDVYTVEVESRHLLRADFVKPRGVKLTMHQCTLAMLTKGQIVSFTFVAGSDEEIDELMDGLHFGAAKSSAH